MEPFEDDVDAGRKSRHAELCGSVQVEAELGANLNSVGAKFRYTEDPTRNLSPVVPPKGGLPAIAPMPRESWTVHDHEAYATFLERVPIIITEGKLEFIKVIDKEAALH